MTAAERDGADDFADSHVLVVPALSAAGGIAELHAVCTISGQSRRRRGESLDDSPQFAALCPVGSTTSRFAPTAAIASATTRAIVGRRPLARRAADSPGTTASRRLRRASRPAAHRRCARSSHSSSTTVASPVSANCSHVCHRSPQRSTSRRIELRFGHGHHESSLPLLASRRVRRVDRNLALLAVQSRTAGVTTALGGTTIA